MNRNLGATSLRRKRKSGDPMRSFDSLPAPLRRWLSQAALPWSPESARRLWNQSIARGLSPEDALSVLSHAEARTLARDRHANINFVPIKSREITRPHDTDAGSSPVSIATKKSVQHICQAQ